MGECRLIRGGRCKSLLFKNINIMNIEEQRMRLWCDTVLSYLDKSGNKYTIGKGEITDINPLKYCIVKADEVVKAFDERFKKGSVISVELGKESDFKDSTVIDKKDLDKLEVKIKDKLNELTESK